MGIKEREEIPNYVKQKHHNFAMPKHIDIYSWLAGFSGEMVIYAFLLRFFSPSHQKSDMSVKYKRLLNRTHHKHKPQSSLV